MADIYEPDWCPDCGWVHTRTDPCGDTYGRPLVDWKAEYDALRARIEALADDKAALARACEAVVAEFLALDPEDDNPTVYENRLDAEELRADEAALRAALSPTGPTKEGE